MSAGRRGDTGRFNEELEKLIRRGRTEMDLSQETLAVLLAQQLAVIGRKLMGQFRGGDKFGAEQPGFSAAKTIGSLGDAAVDLAQGLQQSQE